MSRKSSEKNADALKTNSSASEIIKACARYLRDPNADYIDIELNDALTSSALVDNHSDINNYLSQNKKHENFDDLITELEFSSVNHVVEGSDGEPVICELLLMPIIIGSKEKCPELSASQLDKVTKSFRANNMLDESQSIMALPELLEIDDIEFNYVSRKRILLGMLETVAKASKSAMLPALPPRQPKSLPNNILSLNLRYITMAVVGDAEKFVDKINDTGCEDTIRWMDDVESIFMESSSNLMVIPEPPFYYEHAIDEGILRYAITYAQLKISHFVKSNPQSASECNVSIAKGDFDEGHEIFMYYKYHEKVLDVEKIQLPIPKSDEHCESIVKRFMESVMEACAKKNIGDVEIFDETNDETFLASSENFH